MITAEYYKKDFEDYVVVANTVERLAEAMVASVPTHAMVDWRLDAQKILRMSCSVREQARLLREHGMVSLGSM